MDNQINNTPKISQVNNSKIPKRNRLEQARKLWYKFSLSKLSVVGRKQRRTGKQAQACTERPEEASGMGNGTHHHRSRFSRRRFLSSK